MIKQTTLFQAVIEHPECKQLILGKYSGMGGILEILPQNPKFAKSVVVWLYFKKSVLVGWSWLFRKPGQISPHYSFFVCVAENARQKGIGEKLFLPAKKLTQQRHRRLVVHPWDDRSVKFYNKMKVPEINCRDFFYEREEGFK